MNLNTSLIDKELNAYNTQDLELFCSFYHPEIVVTKLLSKEIVVSGMTQLKEVYGNFFHKFPQIHCELKSRMVTEDTVIDEEFITGREDYPNGQKSVVIYAFRDGLIDRMWFV